MTESHTASPSVWKSLAAGAIGGLVASFAMNQFQAAISAVSESMTKKEQPQKESEDEDVTIKTAKAISSDLFHHELTEDEEKWAGPAVHYALGTALGAIYGVLVSYVPASSGVAASYGTAVWLGGDEIAVPLFGLSGPPTETPLSEHAQALASHLVFGLVTHFTRSLVLS